MKDIELIGAAMDAMKNAYVPYSGFSVGAALLTDGGEVYTGCNVENASYGATCCAERTAVFKAVSEGKLKYKGIAVVGGNGGSVRSFCTPCGICRQVMAEFAEDDFFVLLYDGEKTQKLTLPELLPHSFTGKNLE